MGNKTFHRTITGTLFTDDTDDAARQEICEKMYEKYRLGFADAIKEISAEELMNKIAKDGRESVVLVDCREDYERNVSTIEGSISTKEFEENLTQYNHSEIVCYCTIGYRSGVYCKKLKDKVSVPCYNLSGSVLAWLHAGGKLVDLKGAETNRVHVYGDAWNLAPKEFETVIGGNDSAFQVLSTAQQ